MSPQAIDFCRQRGLNKLHLGTLDTYPPAEPFDLITMLDVVEHVEDDVALLRTARQLLRRGGHLLVAVPAFPSLWGRHDDMLHHKRRYTKGSLRRVVGDGGFFIEHLTFLNAFLFPVAWARRAVARITGTQESNDLMIPARPINAALRTVFTLEKRIVPHTSLPIGLTLLCLARKETE
jgi:SAM-dependent methyltransferase